MAQIPKNFPPTVQSNVLSGRLQGASRSVASSDSSAVEAVNAQDGVLFNDALMFQDHQPDNRGGNDGSQASQIIEYSGSSQTFAAIFENGNATGPDGDVQLGRSRGFANMIARAINTYETNVQIIRGTSVPRGSTLSLTL